MLFLLYAQKTYEINNFELDPKMIPKFMQAGMYKVELLFYKNDVVTGGVGIYLTLA